MNDSTTKSSYPADPRMLAAEAAEAAAMPGPSTTGCYDEVMAARAAEAGQPYLAPLPDGAEAMADEPAPVFGPRPPVTENQASMRYGLGTHDAIERYSQLSMRHHLADAEAKLRARGEWDEAKFGKGGQEPLSADEHLELLATEHLARSYKPTGGQMDRAGDESWAPHRSGPPGRGCRRDRPSHAGLAAGAGERRRQRDQAAGPPGCGTGRTGGRPVKIRLWGMHRQLANSRVRSPGGAAMWPG
jgi:hypothetical protein